MNLSEVISRPSRPGMLHELAMLFIELGTIGFGGPAAHLAMMEDEVVRRRKWMTPQEFLDLVAVTNLIPGPNSTEMAIHIGYRQAGWRGLVVGGLCFVLPAFVIVFGLPWVYVRFHTVPAAANMLGGIQPVIIAIVVQALWRLGRAAVKTRTLAAVGITSAGLNLLGVHELIVLLASAVLMGGVYQLRSRSTPAGGKEVSFRGVVPWFVGGGTVGGVVGGAGVPVGGWPLFLFFLKVGSVLYGSGYVLLAFLRADLVERWGWLTESQLLDAIAIGQVTPGPLFTTATFIGFVLAGPWGAILGTAGMFLPAFVFVAASAPLVPRLRRSQLASAILDGLNAGSLALMAVVTWHLGVRVLMSPVSVVLSVAAGILLVRFRTNSAWLVVGGGVIGLLAGA